MHRLSVLVFHCVNLLSLEKYQDFLNEAVTSRLTESDLRDAIRDYGRVVVSPGGDVYPGLDVFEVVGRQQPTWAVDVPIWTDEGLSELTLELTVIEADGRLLFEVDNLHVL